MPYQIIRHPAIEQDLFDLVGLVAEYAGDHVAERKLDEIERCIHNLAQTPHIGSIRNDLYPGLRAIPVTRKGVITFTVDDETQSVFIVSITYAGADWIRRLPERTEPGSP